MAYGEKYKYYFYWDHDSTSNYYKVSFLKDGYASSVTTLTPGENPFTIDIKGQKDSINQIIFGSEANMEIVVARSDVSTIDTELLATDYKDYIIKLIEDPDGTPLTKWVGFLLPSNSSREFQGNVFTYSLSAVDGLADLKEKQYSTTGDNTGSPYTGFEDMLTIIKTALSKVADFSDLQLNYRVQLGTYSDQMTSTENAFAENEVAQELFYTVEDGETIYDSCYEVIEKILKPFYCSMAQSDGYYWIWCKGERVSYYFEYNWALVQQSRTSNTRSANTFSGASNSELIGRGSLSKVDGISNYNVTVYNRDYNPELLSNGGFDSNVTGWSNGSSDVPANNLWDSVSWYDYPAIGGTMELTWSGSASANTFRVRQTGITLDYGAGAGNVTVTCQIDENVFTHSGSDPNLMRMRLYNSTDGYTTGSIGQVAFLGSGFQNFQEIFTTTGLNVASNTLEIEIQVQDSTTTAVTFYTDNVLLNQANPADDPTDRLYTASLSTANQKGVKEDTIYISDQLESTSDLCAIKDSGGTFTSTWDRYGKTTDDITIPQLLQQQVLNEYRYFKDYVTVSLYDPDQEIDIHKMLYELNVDLGHGTRYFDIIGMNKSYRSAFIKLQLKDNGIEPSADISINQGSKKLSTQYGQSTD